MSEEKKPKKKSKSDENEVDYLRDQLAKQAKKNALAKKSATVTREIQTPYVSVKVTRVVGGRSPKTETTIKASGAIEELSPIKNDVESMINDLIAQIMSTLDDLDTKEMEE